MEILKLFIIMLIPLLMLHFLFKWYLTSILYKNRDLAKEDLEELLTEEEKEMDREDVLDLIISESVELYTSYFDWFLCGAVIAIFILSMV